MSAESDRRKINQLRGMVKVLIPAFVALWLWKGSISKDVEIIASVPPSKSQVEINDPIEIPIYVVGIAEKVDLRVEEDGKTENQTLTPVDKNSKNRKQFILKKSWSKPGAHTLVISGEAIREAGEKKSISLDPEEVTITVIQPRAKVKPLPMQIRQCETSDVLAEVADEYSTATIEKQEIPGDSTSYRAVKTAFPKFDPGKRTITAGADTGSFRLHKCNNCNADSRDQGVVYPFRIVRNQPPRKIDSAMFSVRAADRKAWTLKESVVDDDSSLDPHPHADFSSAPALKQFYDAKLTAIDLDHDPLLKPGTYKFRLIYSCTGNPGLGTDIDNCGTTTVEYTFNVK